MSIKKGILLRVRIAFLLVVLFSLAIIGRILYIQYGKGEELRSAARERTFRYKEVDATRGNIYSANGNLLSTSLPFYKVAFDPTVASRKIFRNKLDSLCMLLADQFRDYTAREYKQEITDARASGRQYLVLSDQLVDYQTRKQMSAWPVFRQGRLKGGVIFEKVDKRFKPFGGLAKRTIGFVNQSRKGVGLEYSFDRQLAGKDGKALFRKMMGNNWKPVSDGTKIKPQQGHDIVSTINVNMQDITQNALRKAVKNFDASYGCAVLMEVETGRIRAIANLGKTGKNTYREDYNYVVGSQGVTEPGSTFKLASMMAMMEEYEMSLTDSVETGNGRKKFYDRTMTDSRPGGYGKISLKQAFVKSSNIGVATLVNEKFGHNPRRFVDYLNDFGLTKPLGVQLVGEGVPFVKNPDHPSWSGVTLPWMSIGYELKLSPLHLLTFYNAVANNGKMIQPMLVTEQKKAGRVIRSYEPEVINPKVCSDKTLKMLHKMLVGVVEEGTAKNIKDTEYKIAGKTGTTQKYQNGHYTNSYYTSFVGYFPASDPKYSCIVVIDDPQGDELYGSNVVAPVFKEIADKVYAKDPEMHKPMPKGIIADRSVFPVINAGNFEDLRLICNNLEISNHAVERSEWVNAERKHHSVLLENQEFGKNSIPDVRGMTLRDALYLLDKRGLNVRYEGTGRVAMQSLSPGSKALKGSQIKLFLERP